jgi:hypothetical protein
LDQEAADLQTRRNALDEKERTQREKAKTLLGGGLLSLAEDPVYHNIYKTIVGRLEKSSDRDLVSSWMPEVKSPPSNDLPASSTKEIPGSADNEIQQGSTAVADQTSSPGHDQPTSSHPEDKSSKLAGAPAPDPEKNIPSPDEEIPQDNAATSDPASSADCDLVGNSPPEAHSSESADPPVPAADEIPPQAETEIHHDDAAVVGPSPAPQPLAISAATSSTQKKRHSPSQNHLFLAPLSKRDAGVD